MDTAVETPEVRDHRDAALATAIRNGTVSLGDLVEEAEADDSSRLAWFTAALASFERANGSVSDWLNYESANVCITRKPRPRLVRLCGGRPLLTLHLIHARIDFAPRVNHLVDRVFGLTIRAEAFTRSSDRSVLVERASDILSFILGSAPDGGDISDSEAELLTDHIGRFSEEYSLAAARSTQLTYLLGMVAGLLPAVGFGALCAWLLTYADDQFSPAVFLAAFGFGALGAIVSVLMRMASGHFTLSETLGQAWIRVLAAVRPFIGGIFGALAYLVLTSELLAVTLRDGDGEFFALCVIAFLAGFSERFARDMLVATERQLPIEGADPRTPTGANSQLPLPQHHRGASAGRRDDETRLSSQ